MRDFAVDLQVNPNTVQRAFQELEEENLVFTERTKGKFITSDTDTIALKKRELIEEKTKEFFDRMQDAGISKKEIIKYLKEV